MSAKDARIAELEAALREMADWPCTCDPAFYERHRPAPDCMADLVGDDAREVLGEPPQCKGRAARRAWAETPEGKARAAEMRDLLARALSLSAESSTGEG